MYTVLLMNEDIPNVSNGALEIWLQDGGSPLPVYQLMSIFQTSDPPHQVYWFSCKFSDGKEERLTIGKIGGFSWRLYYYYYSILPLYLTDFIPLQVREELKRLPRTSLPG